MFVVTVELHVISEHADTFREAVLQQAKNSREREADCHQFDVIYDPAKPGRFFLYEVYTDEAAFQSHLSSSHFLDFDANTKEWIASKTVRVWSRVENTS